ncbi:ribbon-helix-helix protein, CopG family [Pseudolactococcus reticulitermitis]|nr:ribbon-helix-helix protein, CopG family [Lactococcus reticulitermitis]
MKEQKKMGRPSLSDKPSKNIIFRLSEDEAKKFDEYAAEKGKTKSKILREFVLSLISDKK